MEAERWVEIESERVAVEAAEQVAKELAVRLKGEADRIPKEVPKRFDEEETDRLEWIDRKKNSEGGGGANHQK